MSVSSFTVGPVVERFRQELEPLDETAFLEVVDRIPSLPDSDDPSWESSEDPWVDLCRLVAAADVVGMNGWRSAVTKIFERAALGDVYDMMQSIRHGPERAFSDDIAPLVAILEPLARHARPGTRQWSIRELGICRQHSSLSALLDALDDPVAQVRDEAHCSLEMLAQVDPEAAEIVKRRT